MVCMTDTKTVMKFMNELLENGCECTYDLQAGTAEAVDDGVTVYKALRKGSSQPWIVRCTNTERFTFS